MGFGWDQQPRTPQLERLGWLGSGSALPTPDTVVNEAWIAGLPERAEELAATTQLATAMASYHEGWTHHHRMEWRPAFLSCWTSIEIALGQLWAQHVKAQPGATRSRKAVGNWDVGRTLDLLGLYGVLTNDDVSSIHALRELRNKVIHRGTSTSSSDAMQSLRRGAALIADTWKVRMAAPPERGRR